MLIRKSYVYRDGHWKRSYVREACWYICLYGGIALLLFGGTLYGAQPFGYITGW